MTYLLFVAKKVIVSHWLKLRENMKNHYIHHAVLGQGQTQVWLESDSYFAIDAICFTDRKIALQKTGANIYDVASV